MATLVLSLLVLTVICGVCQGQCYRAPASSPVPAQSSIQNGIASLIAPGCGGPIATGVDDFTSLMQLVNLMGKLQSLGHDNSSNKQDSSKLNAEGIINKLIDALIFTTKTKSLANAQCLSNSDSMFGMDSTGDMM